MAAINPFSELSPQLYPATRTLPDHADPSMEYMFDSLRHQWVWDFIFESDHQEADMLQYAVTDQFVVLADFDISTKESDDPHANRFRVREKHRILLLPSFSTGHISVGFGVNERITSTSSFACRQRYTGRVVRDDQRCTTLFIAEDHHLNMVEVSFFYLRSPTEREHHFLMFQRKKFRQAIETVRTNYDDTAMKEALMYYYFATEARPCPTCNLTKCTCPLAITPKRHPLDRDSEILNIRSYTGQYGGVASLGLYTNGRNIFLAQYEAESGIKLSCDFSSQQKLSIWALCSATQKRPVNPVKYIMSEAANMKNRDVTATDTFLLASVAEAVVGDDDDDDDDDIVQPRVSDAVMVNASNMLSNGLPGPGVGVGTALAQVSALAGASGLDLNTLFNDACGPSASGELDFTPFAQQRAEGSIGTSQAMSTVASLSKSTSGPALSDDVDMSDTSATDGMTIPETAVQRIQPLLQTVPSPVTQPIAPSPPLQTIAQSPTLSLPQAVACTNEMLTSRTAATAAARPIRRLAPATRPEANDDDTSAELDERRKKAELRKARNRESAQRSNLKRKQQIQKLKEEIDAASTRENYLRAREKMLREENLSLRTAVYR